MSRRLSALGQGVLPSKRVHLVDASVVCEPRATGSTWRLHHMLDLSMLTCKQLQVTLPGVGELLTRFAVQANDALMVDHGLAYRRDIRHVVNNQGDVIVRTKMVSAQSEDNKACALALLPKLRKLSVGQARGWPAWVRGDQGTIAVRGCGITKSAEQGCKEAYS